MIRKTHVKTDLLKALMSENHLNDAMLAEKLKMNRTTIFRARGDSPVGEQFIAGLLTVFPGKRFEDLFFVREMLRRRNATKLCEVQS